MGGVQKLGRNVSTWNIAQIYKTFPQEHFVTMSMYVHKYMKWLGWLELRRCRDFGTDGMRPAGRRVETGWRPRLGRRGPAGERGATSAAIFRRGREWAEVEPCGPSRNSSVLLEVKVGTAPPLQKAQERGTLECCGDANALDWATRPVATAHDEM